MIIMGARGPIFFSVGLLLVYFSYRLFVQFIITKKLRFWNLLISIISAILVLGILYFIFNDEINFLIKRSLMRLNLILNASDSQNMGKSVDVRLNQVDISLSLIFDNFFNFFFGYGIGSFGILEKGFDHRSYPHNILLEIWVELGFIGVIIFGSFVVKIFLKNIKFKNYIHYFVLLFLLLNSMKSSSIIDIRTYFIIFSLYILNSNRIIFSNYNNTN
jgi:O-antigen ligase